jgi:hypothetical protein
MSKARGLADLGNAFDDGALSNRNILINGNFSVSQRGDFTTASTWGSGYLSYSLDRWKIKRSSMTGTIQDLGNRVKVVASTPSGTDQMMIQQNIEDKNIDVHAGKTVTLSALVKTNRSDCRLMYELSGDTGWMGRNIDVSNNEHSGSGSDERLTATFYLPSNMTGVAVRVYVGFDTEDSVGNISLTAGDYFEAAEVQLEIGDTATPFEHRSYGDELARCQRYYEVFHAGSQTGYIAIGNWWTSNQARCVLQYTEKRTNPSISASDVICYQSGSGIEYYLSETIDDAHSTHALLYGGVSGASTTQGHSLQMRVGANGSIQIDAEL